MRARDLAPSVLALGLAAIGTAHAMQGAAPAAFVPWFVAGGVVAFGSAMRHLGRRA